MNRKYIFIIAILIIGIVAWFYYRPLPQISRKEAKEIATPLFEHCWNIDPNAEKVLNPHMKLVYMIKDLNSIKTPFWQIYGFDSGDYISAPSIFMDAENGIIDMNWGGVDSADPICDNYLYNFEKRKAVYPDLYKDKQ